MMMMMNKSVSLSSFVFVCSICAMLLSSCLFVFLSLSLSLWAFISSHRSKSRTWKQKNPEINRVDSRVVLIIINLLFFLFFGLKRRIIFRRAEERSDVSLALLFEHFLFPCSRVCVCVMIFNHVKKNNFFY